MVVSRIMIDIEALGKLHTEDLYREAESNQRLVDAQIDTLSLQDKLNLQIFNAFMFFELTDQEKVDWNMHLENLFSILKGSLAGMAIAFATGIVYYVADSLTSSRKLRQSDTQAYHKRMEKEWTAYYLGWALIGAAFNALNKVI